MKRSKDVVVIRRSCITGNAVWIYRGPSLKAAREAYRRACKKEVERVRNWPQIAQQRREDLMNFLTKCMAKLPLAELTPEQKECARRIKACEKELTYCHMEFYDHIIEEARRRNEASRRWAENRKKTYGI